MAASSRALSLNSNRSTHKPRYGHNRRRDGRLRRPKSEYHSRSSPVPQIPWHLQHPPTPTPIPSPPSPPNTYSHSFLAPDEHLRSTAMERTSSGSSITSNTPLEHRHHTFPSADTLAAVGVEDRLRRLPPHTSSHVRILRKILSQPDGPDDLALQGILTAVDSIFFSNALAGRVKWEWSSAPEYECDLIGTTAFRTRHPSHGTGIETLIILSEPILLDERYDRRLLLSAFLHELIHCFLFVKCESAERIEGGHSEGFHRIAKCVDQWVGEGELRLCSMLANLSYFRKDGYEGNKLDHQQEVEGSWKKKYDYEHEDEHEHVHAHEPHYDQVYEYESPRIIRDEHWDVRGCVKEAHRHEGCNQSPLHVRDPYDDHNYVEGYDNGYPFFVS